MSLYQLLSRTHVFCACLITIACLLVARSGRAQFTPSVKWDRTFGGNADDELNSVEPTADGGYLLGGWSRSGANGDKTRPNAGRTACWILKVDSAGVKQWDLSYGTASPEDEGLTRAVQTADGGYLLAGGAYSGASGDKTHPGWGYVDFWVIKLDAQGRKQWDRAYGGRDGESVDDMQLTPDGGFILVGASSSGISGDKTQPSRGIFDYWVLKLDAQGNKQWDRTIGGSGNDGASSIILTNDGGYLVGGVSNSGVSGEKSQPTLGGDFDYWIVKLDGQGQIQWDKTLGGSGQDQCLALLPTTDGGYLVGGSSDSGPSLHKSQPSRGLRDFWVLKLNAQGSKQWDITLGGKDDDWLNTLQLDSDGGYLLGGFSASDASGERTQASRGGSDGWLVKLTSSGQVLWDQAVGGSRNDVLKAVIPLPQGGYLLGATSDSGTSGDKTQPSKGAFDYWLVKLQAPRIRGDEWLCAGGQVLLSAPAGAAAYRWNTGASSSTIAVNQPGLYTVTATGTNGVAMTWQHQVRTFTPPATTISGDTLLCSGRTGQLTAAAPGATRYQWSTGAVTAITSVTQPGKYMVTVAFGSGCSQQKTVNVRAVSALPAFTLGMDTTLCEGQSLTLRAPAASGVPVTYRWSDGSAGNALSVQRAGVYSLQLTTACESRTSTRYVAVVPCLTLPNVITPNEDLLNDRWVVAGLQGPGWILEIFNRWGSRVYQSANYANDWGNEASAGVYYYLLRRGSTVHKGWVTVIR